MEILSRLKGVEMMRMKTKNPPLDQTGGPREEELEKNLNQLVYQRRRLPSHLTSLKKDLNLIKRSTGKSAQAEEPIHANEDLEELAHQEFDIGFTEDQPVDKTTQHPDWFQKPTKPPTPGHYCNKTLPAKHGPIQPWISTLARNKDPRESINELMDTPLDFSITSPFLT
ncbi:hypothetical protein Tco_0543082 [Tanacetum coccineum]